MRAKETRVETAWLIERRSVPLFYAQDGKSLRWVVATDPDAWRFADRVSAENVITSHGLTDVIVTEHEWG